MVNLKILWLYESNKASWRHKQNSCLQMWVLNKYQISSGCECKSKYSYHILNTLPNTFVLQNIAGGNFSIDSSYFYFKNIKFKSVIIFSNLTS